MIRSKLLFFPCRIKSLISIAISNVEISFTAPHQFVGYGFGVEELSITRANMKSVNARSFIHIRGLKMLDLSDNELSEIDENAFTEVCCQRNLFIKFQYNEY